MLYNDYVSLLKDKKDILIVFTQDTWLPCNDVKVYIQEIIARRVTSQTILLRLLDIKREENAKIMASLYLTSTPSVVAIKDGKTMISLIGKRGKKEYENLCCILLE